MTNIVNYCKNPSFEVNVTDDWSFFQGGVGGSRNLDATQYFVGVNSCRLRAGNAYVLVRSTTGVSVPNNGRVTVHCRIRCSTAPGADSGWLRITDTLGQANSVYATAASNGAWEYLTVSIQNTAGVARTFFGDFINYFNDSAADVWFDACQLELAAAASPYTDGAQGEGHSWAGTAHNSVSTWTEPVSQGSASISPYMMV